MPFAMVVLLFLPAAGRRMSSGQLLAVSLFGMIAMLMAQVALVLSARPSHHSTGVIGVLWGLVMSLPRAGWGIGFGALLVSGVSVLPVVRVPRAGSSSVAPLVAPIIPRMTPPPLTLLCPGQGAQTLGMGKAWFDASPESRAVFAQVDQILGDRLGAPLSTLCFDGPADRLNRTDASQPAIFVTSIACWKGLLAKWSFGNGEANIAAAAGLSLGEYTALHLAGAIGFEDALELVTLRGRAMQDAAEASPGGMLALIGADETQAQTVCDKARGPDVLVCANFNAPGQIVLSGHKVACDRAAEVASEMGLRATALVVAGAFHSPLMAPAAERLGAQLAKTTITPPRCTVVANVTALPHENTPDSIRRRLVEQLTSPVRWSQSCSWLGTNVKAEFHELAPGKTLSGLMRRIDKSIKVNTHEDPN